MPDALVTGAGGFIGHHLVSYLKEKGHRVRGADLKRPDFEPTEADEYLTTDLREREACEEARDGGTIEVWGDGEQTRSFMYVDDCTEGIHRFMRSDFPGPLNLGTDRLVTINELVEIIAEAAGREITKEHDLSKPQGVRGRNSDNTRLREVLGWEPEVSLEEGIAETYRWIEEQVGAAQPRKAVGG